MFFILELISVLLPFSFVLLHSLLIFGAPFGEYVLGGSDKVLPLKNEL